MDIQNLFEQFCLSTNANFDEDEQETLIRFGEFITESISNSKPSHWLNSQAKNSVISNASKESEGTEALYKNWDTPLYARNT